jgi:hypothetical protein
VSARKEAKDKQGEGAGFIGELEFQATQFQIPEEMRFQQRYSLVIYDWSTYTSFP